ncbi:MAG: MerR family transcriptional regulator [Planctomycetes bacterium]|nr:MerR family transcriptional regulator [Planctomycetota bacterium]
MRTIGDVSRLLGVDRDTIKTWLKEFSDHFSESALPRTGVTRLFSEEDTRALALISQYWEDEPDLENIHAMLNSGDQQSEHFVELVRLNTPIFQEVPDDLDETWTHGVLVSSRYVRPMIEVARSYEYAADELVKEALSFQEPHLLDYPIFFTYRHTLELYLKLILDDHSQARVIGHDLGRLIRAVEEKLGGEASEWTRSRLHEFNDIDPTSDLFRYADRAPEHHQHVEIWVDLCQLKSVMDRLCDAFESHIRHH